ncbi:MAG TPA: ribosome maturation factor RimP [Syntrophomonadaceae bacterium]|nr:ribosome maturation factor RimP [Syntrophomonadaceae bacterium]HNX28500.1 ribosome maturation factor RimP [Syntrophomonadaceae bacterium]HPR93066.1 ribosome maturation factor RimP [Syntrophomonadaceae bacterium]
MDKARFIELENKIEKILQAVNIELVAIEFARDNKAVILRIYIDSENGVDMNLCTQATRAVKESLDKEDVFYDYLEVSSPGLDRVLKKDKDFIRYLGNKVKIKTSKEFNGPRTIVGVLAAVDECCLKVNTGEQTFEIPRQYITIARLKPEI